MIWFLLSLSSSWNFLLEMPGSGSFFYFIFQTWNAFIWKFGGIFDLIFPKIRWFQGLISTVYVSVGKQNPQHVLEAWRIYVDAVPGKALIMASLSLVLASLDDCKGRFLGEVSWPVKFPKFAWGFGWIWSPNEHRTQTFPWVLSPRALTLRQFGACHVQLCICACNPGLLDCAAGLSIDPKQCPAECKGSLP